MHNMYKRLHKYLHIQLFIIGILQNVHACIYIIKGRSKITWGWGTAKRRLGVTF